MLVEDSNFFRKKESREILKEKLVFLSYFFIALGFGVLFIRKYIPIEIFYSLNDLFWCVSATLLFLAFKKGQYFCFIPVFVGVMDEILQYLDLYPPLFDKFYTSTADIKDVIAYILGFIIAIIVWVIVKRKVERKMS